MQPAARLASLLRPFDPFGKLRAGPFDGFDRLTADRHRASAVAEAMADKTAAKVQAVQGIELRQPKAPTFPLQYTAIAV